MALPTYSTGTASVAAGGTVVTGAGCSWTGVNAKQGDFISIGGSDAALITEVTDATHLKVAPWTAGAKTTQPYIIYQNYVGRVVGVAAAEDVGDMLEMLHVDGLPFIVGPTETVPDPSFGDDGQLAFKPTTGQWWTKTGGAWVSTPGYGSDVTKVAKTGDTMTGALTVTVKGSLFGSAGGTAYSGAVTVSDANLLLYNISSASWAGWGVDTSGNAWLRTGTSGSPVPALAARTDQNVIADKFNSAIGNFGGVVGSPWQSGSPLCAEHATASVWPIAVKGNNRGLLYLASSSANIYGFFTQGTLANSVGQISGTTTTTTYATTSDGRRKPTRAVFSGLDIVSALQPVRHNWLGQPDEWSYGLIAQDAVAVLPQMIVRGDDDPQLRPGDEGFVQWGADYSQAVPVLIRAVQELLERIEVLEAAAR
jgi:hypothetical protein